MGTPEEAKMFFGTESLIEIYNLLEEDTESWAGQFDRFNPIPEIPQMQEESVEKPKRKSAIKQLFTLTKRYGELVKNDLPATGTFNDTANSYCNSDKSRCE